ncbi:MAG: tetratricopeptide repeat protein [Spirochaetes bacterium]|jgi:tetratricopeptide (TPR) repeat protein|nr:tetratricopeptide repeat protein [Spirochaetota bacterium]
MILLYFVILLFLALIASYYFFILAPKLDPRNRAQELLKNKKFDEAILEYRKLLDKNPYDFVIQYRLATIYLDTGDFDQAALLFEKLLDQNKFNFEVEKKVIQKNLAKIYYFREEIEKTFEMYMTINQSHPADSESLYHIAFISLGQAEYDFAHRYFDKLMRSTKPDYEIYFGAGICAYQNQKINECVEYFASAIEKKPDSEITNLALLLSLMRKKDYSKAQNYASKLAAIASDKEVTFIALRLEALILLLLKKYETSIKKFELLVEFTQNHSMVDELYIALYDIGFACVRADKIRQAEVYWKRLSTEKRGYRDIQNMLMTLQREMERSDTTFDDTIYDYVDGWVSNFIPKNFLWNICGMKAEYQFDIKMYMTVNTRIKSDDTQSTDSGNRKESVNNVDTFVKLDVETFRMISNRLVQKLGYSVDKIMPTYREHDGVDYFATKKGTEESTFVSVRRWTSMHVGEIPLRNFAQQVNELKAQKGLFITTAELTDGAMTSLEQLSKIDVVLPNEINKYLNGLI